MNEIVNGQIFMHYTGGNFRVKNKMVGPLGLEPRTKGL